MPVRERPEVQELSWKEPVIIFNVNGMELSESAFEEMAALVRGALECFRQDTDATVVTDIHLQPLRESGELVVSDDDHELARSVISDIAEIPENDFYQMMESGLRKVLGQIDSESPLDKLGIWHPFSIVMTDDEGDTQAELMLFDDDTQLVAQTLMSDLDEDLEKFLKELLPD